MNDTSAASSADCAPDKHKEHLCYLQCEGYHYDHKADYKALVQEAQYICQNCGRTAKSAENLCAPRDL